MCNYHQGAPLKLFSNRALDQDIGIHIYGGGGLIENHDLGAGEDGTCETQELTLALGEVEAAIANCGGEVIENVDVRVFGSGGRRVHGLVSGFGGVDEVDALECFFELSVA